MEFPSIVVSCCGTVCEFNFHISLLASSGADLKALVREAAIAALKEYVQLQSSHWVTPDQSDRATSLSSSAIVAAERSKVDVSECSVSMHHFISALERVSPSVSEKVGVSFTITSAQHSVYIYMYICICHGYMYMYVQCLCKGQYLSYRRTWNFSVLCILIQFNL